MNQTDRSQEKLALDVDVSNAYYVPTEPVSRGYVVDEPIVSPRSDSTQDLLIRCDPRTATTSLSNKGDSSPQKSDPNVSITELRNQVWIYSEKVSGIHGAAKATGFPGQIHDNESIPVLSCGRRRLLTAIGESSATSRETRSLMASSPSELLTETSYCARRLHDFMCKRFMDLPDFLEERLVRERPSTAQHRLSMTPKL
jgi:hypothetical protein